MAAHSVCPHPIVPSFRSTHENEQVMSIRRVLLRRWEKEGAEKRGMTHRQFLTTKIFFPKDKCCNPWIWDINPKENSNMQLWEAIFVYVSNRMRVIKGFVVFPKCCKIDENRWMLWESSKLNNMFVFVGTSILKVVATIFQDEVKYCFIFNFHLWNKILKNSKISNQLDIAL